MPILDVRTNPFYEQSNKILATFVKALSRNFGNPKEKQAEMVHLERSILPSVFFLIEISFYFNEKLSYHPLIK